MITNYPCNPWHTTSLRWADRTTRFWPQRLSAIGNSNTCQGTDMSQRKINVTWKKQLQKCWLGGDMYVRRIEVISRHCFVLERTWMNVILMENTTFLQHAGTTFSAMRSANHGTTTTTTFLGASSYIGADARVGGARRVFWLGNRMRPTRSDGNHV